MSRLAGKTAVITGGTTGIGFETAKYYLQEGARVIITGQNEARLSEAAAKLGKGVKAVLADASKLADLDNLRDVLFVNAGVAVFAPLEDTDESTFDYQFNVNVKGAFFTIQKLAGLLKSGSSVIINASAVNEKGLAGASAYSATKAAVRSFARSLAAELGPRGIRVNALSPGYVPTEIQGKMGVPREQLEASMQELVNRLPLARAGRTDEIAKVAVFLASDESSYITATDLTVDGGFMNV